MKRIRSSNTILLDKNVPELAIWYPQDRKMVSEIMAKIIQYNRVKRLKRAYAIGLKS